MNDMNSSEIKKMMISSLEDGTDNNALSSELQKVLSYDFREGFEERVLGRIFSEGTVIKLQYEADRNLNLAFYRIAMTGVAAIVFLILSMFLSEGSLSFDSFLGLSDVYSESIVCLLTGN
jgi:hypothetical protein